MEVSKTLFVVNPEDKFLCSYHGGLMDVPFENSSCLHCFCSFCIETLTNCPIDNSPIINISLNEQLKDEFDQLLCYCQYGVEENPINGEITTKVNGCNCLISYGSKLAHEQQCRFNNNINNQSCGSGSGSGSGSTYSNDKSSPILSHQDFYEMRLSGDSFSSPKSNASFNSSKSPSFENISPPPPQQQPISPVQQSSPIINNNKHHQEEEYFDNNALWESSTTLFFCNRYCPNKEFGCFYSGKTEQDITYHLEVECYCQKMKDKISQLEQKVEEKEKEIKVLKSYDSTALVGKTTPSTGSSLSSSPLSLSSSLSNKDNNNFNNNSNNNKNNNKNNNNSSNNIGASGNESDENYKKSRQIQNYTIGKIFHIFFQIVKKGIKKSFKKVKKFFKRKNSDSPYKNFIKIK
ncbi:hypothetical protein ACTA71_000458 [Dictyostelium dimigraforme]